MTGRTGIPRGSCMVTGRKAWLLWSPPRVSRISSVSAVEAGLTLCRAETAKRNVIPIIITWSGGGKQVYVTGSFNSWKQKVRLNRRYINHLGNCFRLEAKALFFLLCLPATLPFSSDDDFTTILDLPPGTHHFKFIVDGEWRCSDDLPARADDDGNLVNYLEVYDERGRNMNDGLDDVGDQSPGGTPDSASPLSTTPSEQYTNHIPTFYLPVPPPDPPPPLPPQLESVVLNKPPPKDNEVDALNVPNHVALNHLYACSIRDGVMAVAGTTRYRRKVGLVYQWEVLATNRGIHFNQIAGC